MIELVPFDFDGNIRRIQALAQSQGTRVALTPASRRVGCRGCHDGENLRHPGSQPFRCSACPVNVLRGCPNRA